MFTNMLSANADNSSFYQSASAVPMMQHVIGLTQMGMNLGKAPEAPALDATKSATEPAKGTDTGKGE
jgi:hypothetical protein